MKFLLLVAVAVTARLPGSLGVACPDASAISPCTCIKVSNIDLKLDCSNVPDDETLAQVFQKNFPSKTFYSLTIDPITPYEDLTKLQSFVFNGVSFQFVTISNTLITTIQEEALSPSHDSLLSLDLRNNMISSFPTETLPLFVHLRDFNLANNHLDSLPSLESSSLLKITLSGNKGLSLREETFIGATQVEQLYLSNMNLAPIPSNVFSTLNFIKTIDLSYNKIQGELQQAFMRVPLDSLETLVLSHNSISQINPTAITGIDRSLKIDFRNNKITSLDFENWYPLFDQLTSRQAIDLRNNPLACSCDVLWILLHQDQMDKLHSGAKCSDGTFLANISLDDLLAVC